MCLVQRNLVSVGINKTVYMAFGANIKIEYKWNALKFHHIDVIMREKSERLWRAGGKWWMNNLVSDCCGKSNAIIVAVKLSVVAGNEIGSQNPDGTHGGRDVQTSEGNDADVSLDLRLLDPEKEKSVLYIQWSLNVFLKG